jgi:hypothetical protein
MATTAADIVDIEQTEGILMKNMRKFPHLAKHREEYGDLPSCFFEEELLTQDEWRRQIEKTVYERLGFRITLPSSE